MLEEAGVLRGLERAELLEPGAGVFDLGLVMTPAWYGARASVTARPAPSWSAYLEASVGAEWATPLEPFWYVGGGLRFRW